MLCVCERGTQEVAGQVRHMSESGLYAMSSAEREEFEAVVSRL